MTLLSTNDDNICRLSEAWRQHLQAIPAPAHQLLEKIANGGLEAFVDHFYVVLLADPKASRFLSPRQVQTQLKPALRRWLHDLLLAEPEQAPDLVKVNRHVGLVHARMGIPVDLVLRGMRDIRQQLFERIGEQATDARNLGAAIAGCCLSMDIALEAMTQAYGQAVERSSRTDVAYQLFTLVQNVSTERERQRVMLLDWENSLLYAVAGANGFADVQKLSDSGFGLWFGHKGAQSFGDMPEAASVAKLIDQVDELLHKAVHANDVGGVHAVLVTMRERISLINHLMSTLFERFSEVRSGADALTNLLNRRFLPTVLRREIELADAAKTAFAVMLLDLDHFKEVNDSHGHESGDIALQHVANILNQHTRASDYLFRLGGEEFIIVLVSVTLPQAENIAEDLRARIAASRVRLPNGISLNITVSIGVAMYDGHPDYERLLARADAAMYEAKKAGRDRIAFSPSLSD